jgi:putative transposase
MSATSEANQSKRAEKTSGHKNLRKGRVSIPGHVYLLTTTTLFRRPIFRDFEAAKAVASVHKMKWVWRNSQCLAWVLMPDHWHGLIILGENDQLDTLMGRFKMASSKNVSDKHKTNGWLWARSYYDHAFRSDEVLRDVGRYVVANPLRAGLVKDIGLYPFWDAVWLDPNAHDSLLGL